MAERSHELRTSEVWTGPTTKRLPQVVPETGLRWRWPLGSALGGGAVATAKSVLIAPQNLSYLGTRSADLID